MQPELANPGEDMPWLWWSMRFLEQEGRNLVKTVSPFEAEDKDPAANALPILRKRQVKHSKIKLGVLVGIPQTTTPLFRWCLNAELWFNAYPFISTYYLLVKSTIRLLLIIAILKQHSACYFV